MLYILNVLVGQQVCVFLSHDKNSTEILLLWKHKTVWL